MCFFDSVLPKKHNLNQVIPGHIIAESMVYVGPVFSGPGCSVRRLAPDGVGVSQDVVELFFRLFFTDCTMVNHHHTTTWENLLELFPSIMAFCKSKMFVSFSSGFLRVFKLGVGNRRFISFYTMIENF